MYAQYTGTWKLTYINDGQPIPSTAWLYEKIYVDSHVEQGTTFRECLSRSSGGPPTNSDGKTTERWTKIHPSACDIVRSVSLGGSAAGTGPHGKAKVSLTYQELHLYAWYDGPTSDRKHRTPIDRCGAPTYGNACSNHSRNAGQSGSDPVDLATGEHLYPGSPDIAVYNPYGPGVVYQRNFLSLRAKDGYGSPGLSTGWVDGYDARMTPTGTGTWRSLVLTYPNGATETLAPALDDGDPTGDFTVPTGSDYFVTGTPSGTTDHWDSIVITFNDQTTWSFAEAGSDVYRLSRIGNRVGHYISIERDSANNYRLSCVKDDSSPTANTLLSMNYFGTELSSVVDTYGRKVTYSFQTDAGETCLWTVSQIGLSSQSNIPSPHYSRGA
jgi:hypothetical protein